MLFKIIIIIFFYIIIFNWNSTKLLVTRLKEIVTRLKTVS